MIHQIDGQHYKKLIDYGIRNLSIHKDYVNDLNVFPVPDGDTGTNMALTLQNGFAVIAEYDLSLREAAAKFAKAVVYGARGNSGVITSQFFKGFSEQLATADTADVHVLAEALDAGVKCAYGAVAQPVEGTILTVMREATEAVVANVSSGEIQSVDELISVMLAQAESTLAHTPELLPVLKSAGVVDSGGAGFVFVLQGMKKYLAGEPLSSVQVSSGAAEIVDYSRFSRTDTFPLGYCTELLLQLTDNKEDPDPAALEAALGELGDSLVLAFEGDKVKVHVHTQTPEQVLSLCHAYGEFLSLKIENMSVQHSEQQNQKKKQPYVTYDDKDLPLSVVTVAHDPSMRERFMEMGADVVINCDQSCPPSTQDFLEVFDRMNTDAILVFPNSKNTALAAEQAKALYQKSNIVVFHTTSDAACYAALPMINFDEDDLDGLAEQIQRTLDDALAVSVVMAQKSTCINGIDVQAGHYVAVAGSDVLASHPSRRQAAMMAADRVMETRPFDVLTVFTGAALSDEVRDAVSAHLCENYPYTEVDFIETENDFYSLVLYFEG